MIMTTKDPTGKVAGMRLEIAAEVEAALRAGTAVVALETTFITHGLPWPVNLETAHAMQRAVHEGGAVPAIIGIDGGRVRIGLDEPALERFARAEDVHKASRRDLAILTALGRDGATTVAGTMACAAMAGIKLFATGGIGGVHRDFEATHDVSADLTELGRSPVAVVCSGAKSILDLGRTLEYLETQGVPVVGFGTDHFPAFYLADSGFDVDARVDTPEEAARIISAHRALGGQGLLIANPIPSRDALEPVALDAWTVEALANAQSQNVRGKDVTPFLLDRIFDLSGGAGLEANKALLIENAKLGARIALALTAD